MGETLDSCDCQHIRAIHGPQGCGIAECDCEGFSQFGNVLRAMRDDIPRRQRERQDMFIDELTRRLRRHG